VTGALYFAPPLALLGLVEAPIHEDEELLRSIPLFERCSPQQLRFITARVARRDVPAGATLCREGERGGDFFLIVDGTADASRDGSRLRRLGRGDFFGEIALIDEGARTATVTSTSPLRCLVLSPQQFREVLEQNADIAVGILEAVTERLRATAPAGAVATID